MTDLRYVPILENGEPLVEYLGKTSRLIEARPRWSYNRFALLRKGVAERLWDAAESLPDGYSLAIIEGWRPEYIQKRMYLSSWKRWKQRHPDWSDTQLRRVVNRFTAPLHAKVPPPHSTGAAFDITLADSGGQEVDMTSPFVPFDSKAYLTATPDLDEQSKRHRSILIEALSKSGITNYPSEWWHWSFGDQGWAYRTDHPHAIYGPIQPENFVGFSEDMVEDELARAQ